MPEPVTAAAAAGALLGGMAGDIAPDFIADLVQPRKILNKLRARLKRGTPAENHDIYRDLTDAYWVVLLQATAQIARQIYSSAISRSRTR